MALLEVDGVTKVYRKGVEANLDVSLTVEEGEVFGLLGHNGAGKTTLLNQVIGLARPTSGTIRLDGRDAVADPDMARRFCSFQPQTLAPLEGLTPRQAIEMMARIRGAGRRHAATRAAELIAALDILPWADRVGDKLSGGVKRLTAFCMAAAEPGRLVMFDEPTNDVDPVRRKLLWNQIRLLAESGCGVVLVTHNVVEAERAVERLAVLDKGRVIAQGTPAGLRGDDGGRLRLELLATDPQRGQEIARQFDGILIGRRVVASIAFEQSADLVVEVQKARAEGRVEEFSITPVSLEDIYIQLVGSDTETELEEAGRAGMAS